MILGCWLCVAVWALPGRSRADVLTQKLCGWKCCTSRRHAPTNRKLYMSRGADCTRSDRARWWAIPSHAGLVWQTNEQQHILHLLGRRAQDVHSMLASAPSIHTYAENLYTVCCS